MRIHTHAQIASALDFLHGKHVVYLDLKSDNVLVWKFPLPGHQKTNQEVLLKITDYGISRMSSTANGIRYSSIAGTPGFIAPEVYTGKHQDLQSDKVFPSYAYSYIANITNADICIKVYMHMYITVNIPC